MPVGAASRRHSFHEWRDPFHARDGAHPRGAAASRIWRPRRSTRSISPSSLGCRKCRRPPSNMCGSPAPWRRRHIQELVRRYLCANLWNLYGANEVGYLTIADPALLARLPDSIGVAAPGVEISVVDQHGRRM